MRSTPLFRDRADAGRILARLVAPVARDAARHVSRSAFGSNPLILALPRGGVPVGFELARTLHAEFDVFVVRKLGMPGHEELAIGAIATGGVRVLNEDLIGQSGLSADVINLVAQREQQELERRERTYRNGRAPASVANRVVILVDDGLATGATMRAAVKALRIEQAARIIVAVPVAPPETCEELRDEADQVICAETPEPFAAIGLWYENFAQTTDEEVRSLLEQAASRAAVH
jgi:putative phosphoribosyl transferase